MALDERSNHDYDSRVQQRHRAMTVRALIDIFEYDPSAAQEAVYGMWERFQEEYMRDRLTHEDAVNLAAEIAKIPTTEVYRDKRWADRLPKYREAIRDLLDAAATDYEENGRRLETEARIRELAHRFWEQEGRQEGRDGDYWGRAEAEIAAEAGTHPDAHPARHPPMSMRRRVG
jgi:hypothetical protein